MARMIFQLRLTEEALNALTWRLSPADSDWLFSETFQNVVWVDNDMVTIFTPERSEFRAYLAYRVIRARFETILKSKGVKDMWYSTGGMNLDGRAPLGPFEAGSVVSLIYALDALTGVFDRDMTLDEIEGVLYDCLSEIVTCPTCRGLGKIASDIYCNRCAGTGYLYMQEV